jgi:hypothetical protein
MTTIFVDVPVNQSFVNAVQRLSSVKIYAEKDQDIFKLFPRVIDIAVGKYDMFEICKKVPFNSAIIVIRDELFFLPETFLVLESSAKSLNKIYATPFDITGTPFLSSTILYTSGRHWAVGISPSIKSFAVQNSTLIEDEEIWKQFGDSVWNALEVLSQRRAASPIPSLCAKPKEFPPGINWPDKK